MEKIDLHIHTNNSDGEKSFCEIIDMAKKNDIKTISVTDHDTISGYTKHNIEYARKKGIKLITGVEISTKTKKCGIHILGYNIDIMNKNLNIELDKLRNSRHIYLKEVTRVLRKIGYVVNYNKLSKIEAVTKAHIADNIVNNPKNKKKLISEFGCVPNKGLFIETLMNEGQKAFIKKNSITPKEAAKIIRDAGGIVVLAHPMAYTYEDNLTDNEIISIIKDISADGIESYYIYVDKNNKVINDIDKWVSIANDHSLFSTIGSDFHKEDGIRPTIGLENIINQLEIVNSDSILSNF